MFDMVKMVRQAQEMQSKLQEVQEKLMDIEVQGEAGGGLIKVRMNCAGKILKIDIDQELLAGDKETLEDLMTAALNNVNQVKDDTIKEETQNMMKGMDLPPEMMGGGQGGAF